MEACRPLFALTVFELLIVAVLFAHNPPPRAQRITLYLRKTSCRPGIRFSRATRGSIKKNPAMAAALAAWLIP